MDKPLDETKGSYFFGEYTHATHVAEIAAAKLSNDKENNALINNAHFIKVGTKVNQMHSISFKILNVVNPRVAIYQLPSNTNSPWSTR